MAFIWCIVDRELGHGIGFSVHVHRAGQKRARSPEWPCCVLGDGGLQRAVGTGRPGWNTVRARDRGRSLRGDESFIIDTEDFSDFIIYIYMYILLYIYNEIEFLVKRERFLYINDLSIILLFHHVYFNVDNFNDRIRNFLLKRVFKYGCGILEC